MKHIVILTFFYRWDLFCKFFTRHPTFLELSFFYYSTLFIYNYYKIYKEFYIYSEPKMSTLKEGYVKVRKTTRRGGWIVFLKTSSFTFWRTVLTESEVVQSLSEFRVFVQRINVKNRGRKNTSNYTGSFYKSEVVLSPLHFQGEFH